MPIIDEDFECTLCGVNEGNMLLARTVGDVLTKEIVFCEQCATKVNSGLSSLLQGEGSYRNGELVLFEVLQ
jgi:hypothetical protein